MNINKIKVLYGKIKAWFDTPMDRPEWFKGSVPPLFAPSEPLRTVGRNGFTPPRPMPPAPAPWPPLPVLTDEVEIEDEQEEQATPQADERQIYYVRDR